MLKKEDFELTLEEQLRLRVIKDEITACSDFDKLKEHFLDTVELMMKYQHILNRLLKEQLHLNMESLVNKDNK